MDCPAVNFHGIELQSQEKGDSKQHSFLAVRTANLEEHEILTSSGLYQRVYVQPNKNKTALITYHDIGTNHTSFLSLFNNPEMRVITEHFTVYHICAPGHHENAPNLSFGEPGQDQVLLSQPDMQKQRQSISSVSGSRGSIFEAVRRRSSLLLNRSRYPNMDQLADMITSILVHFGINYFLGFGMGAGSNILARYALRYPDQVLGLFLINPNASTHGYYQWFRNVWSDLPALERGVLTDNLMSQLEAHWFGYGLVENVDVANFYESLTRSLNPANLAGYIRSYVDRTPLPLVRPVGLPMPDAQANPNEEPSVILTEVCLVTGDRAVELSRALADMNGRMDPKRTQFLMMPDCTGMVMEENPNKLIMNFLHFLRSIGLVVNLTPEKMRQQAIDLQQSMLEELPETCLPAKLIVEPEV
uniref:Clone ZZD1070 mRNA sequence n=1 Tax=Schistosoma japonicum TaxID=6182 RepID=Q86F66_SCHJA|nr:similar to XM_080170 misexpression suppressor of KSR 2 in Drosophila melanogaster [Schistosoma japonicum]